MKRMVGNMVVPVCPREDGADSPVGGPTDAQEAMYEAFEHVGNFRTVSKALHGPDGSARILASAQRVRDEVDDEDEEELDDALEDIPLTTLITVLLRQANAALAVIPLHLLPADFSSSMSTNTNTVPDSHAAELGQQGKLRIRPPAEIWQISQQVYEQRALANVTVADVWGKRIMAALQPDVEAVLGALDKLWASSSAAVQASGTGNGSAKGNGTGNPLALGNERDKALLAAIKEPREWVRALAVVGVARCEVAIAGAA